MICPGGKELVETALFTPIIAHGNKHYCCFFYSFDPVSEPEFRRIPKEGHITDLQQSRKYSTTCNVALLYNSVVY